jgi:hypothetical protein
MNFQSSAVVQFNYSAMSVTIPRVHHAVNCHFKIPRFRCATSMRRRAASPLLLAVHLRELIQALVDS